MTSDYKAQINQRLEEDARRVLADLPEDAKITVYGEFAERQEQWIADDEKVESEFYESPFFKKFSGREPES